MHVRRPTWSNTAAAAAAKLPTRLPQSSSPRPFPHHPAPARPAPSAHLGHRLCPPGRQLWEERDAAAFGVLRLQRLHSKAASGQRRSVGLKPAQDAVKGTCCGCGGGGGGGLAKVFAQRRQQVAQPCSPAIATGRQHCSACSTPANRQAPAPAHIAPASSPAGTAGRQVTLSTEATLTSPSAQSQYTILLKLLDWSRVERSREGQ